jgi:glycosyltransferase involved in cell wall biosynthesis
MKILVIQDFLRSGGTERQSVLLANAFAAAGHTATLLTFRPGGALAGTVTANVAHHSLQPLDLHVDWFAPGLINATRAAAPNVVLCMGRMANCHAGRLQRRLPATPVLATMRTGKPLPRLFRHSLTVVRHVVANSRDACDSLVRHYSVAPGKISVIHNSLVFPAEPREGATVEPREVLRARHGATPTTTVMLCVAMFRPEKNQRELIEIAGMLPSTSDWQLWLAGDGSARHSCEQLAVARQLGSRVKFLGFHRDPSTLYRAADIAVHASWSEALSNFLIEAQAHGLPAVAYEAQGIEECFLPGRTGWAIARDDRAAFVAMLSRLIAQPVPARVATAAIARAYARETFDPARQVAAYLQLFSHLMAESRVGTGATIES